MPEFVIVVWDPFEGVRVYGDRAGLAFGDEDQAYEVARSMLNGQNWRVVEVFRAAIDS